MSVEEQGYQFFHKNLRVIKNVKQKLLKIINKDLERF